MSQEIDIAREGHIATVTLVHPTMRPSFFPALEQAFEELSHEEQIRAVVVRGCEKGFSFGLDLAAAGPELGPLIQGGLAKSRHALRDLIRSWQRPLDAVARCPKPVIAAIAGRCIGGGLDLAAACDIRLAATDAKFSLREARVAIVADLGSLQRLAGVIGKGHLRELAFTAKDIDAKRAHAIGLVNDVLEDRDATYRAAMEMATEIAENSPLAVQGAKDVLNLASEREAAEGLAYVATYNAAFLASEDLMEAMQAFMEKRKAQFQGR